MMRALLIAALLATPAAAQDSPAAAPAAAAPSEADGLAAWARIETVVTHPRCANCHVGDDNIPMWSGPSYGRARPHGMAVDAGESRMGAETLICATCHVTSDRPNDLAHAPPHAALDWQLAPVEFAWFDRTGAQICAQLRDPDRNGGRDAEGLVAHLRDDAAHGGFVQWGWNPGAGREPAPGSLVDHIADMEIWGAAGQPCPPA